MGIGLASKKRVPSYEGMLQLCCAITFGCYIGSHMRIPVVPLFARAMGADIFQVGTINASFLFMAALLSLPLGILSDRLGRKRLILSGLLIISTSSFLLCFSTSVWEMIGVHLLLGVGLAAYAPTMMYFVADFSPPTHLGRFSDDFSRIRCDHPDGFLHRSGFPSPCAAGSHESSSEKSHRRGCYGTGEKCPASGMLGSFAMGAVIREIGFSKAFVIVAMTNLAATGLFHLVFCRVHGGRMVRGAAE